MKACTLATVAEAIRAHRYRYANEAQLQDGIRQALELAGFHPTREVLLDARSRIDLVVGRIGVEVKVTGSVRDVRAQVARYLASPLLDGLVLVTSRVNHLRVADPRVHVVTLAADGLL